MAEPAHYFRNPHLINMGKCTDEDDDILYSSPYLANMKWLQVWLNSAGGAQAL